MSALAQLAEHLGLSSITRPAPDTAPVHPAANDSQQRTSAQALPAALEAPAHADGIAAATEQPTYPTRYIVTAATAAPEWRQRRDQYMSHLMSCRACYAPTNRYCQTGTELRAIYNATPFADS